MMNQTEQPTTTTTTQPELAELGYAMPCPHCLAARTVLKELQVQGKGLGLAGDTWNQSNGKYTEGSIKLNSMSIVCGQCLDTGVMPTPKGWKVIALVKAFMDKADVHELNKSYEIPF